MILRDGPPRMVARSTWSGRERSSHSRFLPVPRVGLVTFAFLVCLFVFSPSPCFLSSFPSVSSAPSRPHRFVPLLKLPVFRLLASHQVSVKSRLILVKICAFRAFTSPAYFPTLFLTFFALEAVILPVCRAGFGAPLPRA